MVIHLRKHSRGYTLVELMVTLMVIAILTAIGIPSYVKFVANQKVKAVSSDLYLMLLQARSEAVKRNLPVTVAPVSGSDWTSGWTFSTSASTTAFDNHSATSGVSISNGPSSVVYLMSGRIQGGTAPSFTLTSQARSSVQQCVTADPSGLPLAKTAAC